MMRIIILLLITTFSIIPGYANTIEIPADASSIEEAIELATDGDAILITSATAAWSKTRIRSSSAEFFENPSVSNKQLTIKGSDPDNRAEIITRYQESWKHGISSMFQIFSSQISFENLIINSPTLLFIPEFSGDTGGFINVDASSSLTLQNCTFTANIDCQGNLYLYNTELTGYSWVHHYAYTRYESMAPAIKLGPSENKECIIKSSTVRSDTDTSYICMELDQFNNSQLTIENASIIGGTNRVGYGSYPTIDGSDALKILNCLSLNIELISYARFQGGDGYHPQSHRFGMIRGGGAGGNGFSIIDSNINLNYARRVYITGANGGNSMISLSPYDGLIIVEAGRGGDGISLKNSTLTTNSNFDNMNIQSGIGGRDYFHQGHYTPSGEDGKPFNLDENSEIINLTSINEWYLFEN